jgi:hypothetical protein
MSPQEWRFIAETSTDDLLLYIKLCKFDGVYG